MSINREYVIRVVESIFMLTSEGNRVFSLSSLRTLTGEYCDEVLNWLIDDGVIARLNSKYLKVTVPRLQLLVMMGSEPVINHVGDLSWSEFEEFVSFTMRQAGYRTLRGVRVEVGNTRGEFDVIGYRGNIVLVVEAKHWLSISSGELGTIVERHMAKVKALADNWGKFIRKVKVKVSNAHLYPVIVTLKPPQVQVLNGVPIVSSHQLLSFLEGFRDMSGDFTHFEAKVTQLG